MKEVMVVDVLIRKVMVGQREEMPQPLPTDGKQATELLCNAIQVAGV